MEQVTVSRHVANEFPELKAFDIQQHKKALFGMYAGEEKEVSLRADKSLIDVLFDFFGSDTNVFEVGENTIGCNVHVQLSPQFFGWCCSFGDKLKIDSPDFVVEEFKKYLENLASCY